MTLNECQPFDEDDCGQKTKSHNIVDRTFFTENNRKNSGITTISSTSSRGSTRSSKSSKSQDSSSIESISVTSIQVMKDARAAYQDNIYSISKSSYMKMGGGQDAIDNTQTNIESFLIDTVPQEVHDVPSVSNANVFEEVKSSESESEPIELKTYRLSLNEAPPPPVHKDTPCLKPIVPKSCREMSLDEAPPPPVHHKDTPRPRKTSFMSKLSPKVFIRKSKRAENGLTENKPIISAINEDDEAVSDLQHKGFDVESLTNEAALSSKSNPDIALSTAATNEATNIIISETLVRDQSKCSVLTEETTESSSNGKLKDDNQTNTADGGIQSSSSQENYVSGLIGKLLNTFPLQCNNVCVGVLESEEDDTGTGNVPLCSSDGLFYTDLPSPSPSGFQSLAESCSFGEIFTVASAATEPSSLTHNDSVDSSLAVEAYTDFSSQTTRIGFIDQEIMVQPSADEIDKIKSRMMNYPKIQNLFRKKHQLKTDDKYMIA